MVKFNFSATLQSTANNLLRVGDLVTGNCVYDETQTGTAGVYVYNGSTKVHTFSFKVFRDGQQVFADSFYDKTNFSITLCETLMTVKGFTLSLGNFKLVLTNSSNSTNKLPNQASISGFALNNCLVEL